jgi:hypothetical protein
MENERIYKDISNHSLDDLKRNHSEARQFFGSQLLLLNEAIPRIENDKIAKAAVLLMSCGGTGEAILLLASQTDPFFSTTAMLARSFMETIVNFCYVSVCDEAEYQSFILHPIYRQYHNVGFPKFEDGTDSVANNFEVRKKKQEKLKEIPVVMEALAIFSENKSHLSWTKKNLNQRIEVVRKWGKLLDVFFTICKIQYYSDASEALHGSLYGCTYNFGTFDPEFDRNKKDELEKKLYKDSACVLLHLGILIHESLTLISYSSDIKEIWNCSCKNRGRALNLLFHIWERKTSRIRADKK